MMNELYDQLLPSRPPELPLEDPELLPLEKLDEEFLRTVFVDMVFEDGLVLVLFELTWLLLSPRLLDDLFTLGLLTGREELFGLTVVGLEELLGLVVLGLDALLGLDVADGRELTPFRLTPFLGR